MPSRDHDQEKALLLSEARFRALFRDNPTMIVILDSELRILSANPSCTIQLGYTIDQLEGRSCLNLFARDDRAAVAEKMRICLENPDQVYRWQFRKIRADGALLWVEETAQAMYDLNGAPNLLVVCQDITERKKAEEALLKSERKFSDIFHLVPALIGITTVAEGRCIDINEASLRILGYQREEIIGKTMLELGVWESKSARDRLIQILQKDGMVRDLEVDLKAKNGNTVTGLFSAAFIDLDGERYMLSIISDITERKRMEEEIKRLNAELAERAAELEASNKEQEAFNHTVAHDLRQPLTLVNSYCQVIDRLFGDQLPEECLGYVRDAYNVTLRMNRIIDSLLNFARMSSVEPRRRMVDLSLLAQEAFLSLKKLEPERQVDFRVADGIVANVDAELLRAVLDNLLGNAWKYTHMRETAVIEFGVADVDGVPTYFVRDNGVGFDMVCAANLFSPFLRLPGAEMCRGFGIGLATVERIIRRHGGNVWAEGEPDKGACIYFTLGGAQPR